MERRIMAAFVKGENASGGRYSTYSYRGTPELIEGRKLVAINLPSKILADETARPETIKILTVVCEYLNKAITFVKPETLPESTCTF